MQEEVTFKQGVSMSCQMTPTHDSVNASLTILVGRVHGVQSSTHVGIPNSRWLGCLRCSWYRNRYHPMVFSFTLMHPSPPPTLPIHLNFHSSHIFKVRRTLEPGDVTLRLLLCSDLEVRCLLQGRVCARPKPGWIVHN